MKKTNWETVFMFNRPNLVCSGYHGLVAHLQALPSISITTFSSIVGYCLSLLRLGKCLPNVTHLNGRMLFVGGGDGGLIPPVNVKNHNVVFVQDMIPRHSGMVSMLLYFGYLSFAFACFYFAECSSSSRWRSSSQQHSGRWRSSSACECCRDWELGHKR